MSRNGRRIFISMNEKKPLENETVRSTFSQHFVERLAIEGTQMSLLVIVRC